MRYLKTTAFFALAGLVVSPAYADDNAQLCSMYSKTGGAMSEFMLPLTLQDFINITTGKDETLTIEMTGALMGAWNAADMVAASKLGQSDIELLSESAGQVAVELMLSGQANSHTQVREIMKASCLNVTARGIINNQRRAKQATDANMAR